ncbi:MAG: cbb3-type cytochrome c oxidase subunit 3 [Pseudomonadales bacterium]|nr:cbb3-type cytochrome c oxidase subunit 3 [Pseudomonadales bacterium]
MSATLFSLLAVTIGFSALVVWVYWPSNRQKLESYGSIPLDLEEAQDGGTSAGQDSTDPEGVRT